MTARRFLERVKRRDWRAPGAAVKVGPSRHRFEFRVELYTGEGREELERQVLYDLEGWIPDFNPSAGDYCFGVDRAVDPVMLSGIRVNCAGLSYEEAILRGCREAVLAGGSPTWVVMPEPVFDKFLSQNSSRVTVKDGDPVLNGFRGPMAIFPDDVNDVFVLQEDTWEVVGIGDEDDKWRKALICNAPRYNARLLNFGS